MDFISERKTNRRPRQSSSCGGVASGEDGMWRARWRGRRGVREGASAQLPPPPNTWRMHVRAGFSSVRLRRSWLPPLARAVSSSVRCRRRRRLMQPLARGGGSGGGDSARLLARPGRNQPVRQKSLILVSCLRSNPAQEVRRPSNELRGPGWKVQGGAEQMRSPCCRASRKAPSDVVWSARIAIQTTTHFQSICRTTSLTTDPVKASRMCECESFIRLPHKCLCREGFIWQNAGASH